MKMLQTLTLLLAASFVSCAAFAQWQWLDKDGNRVFSDRAPPSDVPDKNILRQPSPRRSANVPAPAITQPEPTGAQPQAAAGALKPSGLDKEMQDKKKQAADAEAAKRKAEDERIATAKAENCTRARQTMSGISSGVRMARTNEKGEREFMDEAARAEEARRTQSIIDQDCK
jgi:Domain of unknown function (DUF4124)